jgi:AbrB family looped-hinge helix DNA binding protein
LEWYLLFPFSGYNIDRPKVFFLSQEFIPPTPAAPARQTRERTLFMNLAKISANGQITVPAEIRRLLGLKSGDKILFLQNSSGEIVINNASAQAIYKAQKAFEGAAEQMGVSNEDEVQALVNEIRYGKE